MTQPTTDGFTNLVSNLGAANGKTAHNRYTLTPCTQHEVEFAYRTSTWFGKIVDIPADDATREWRSWKAGSKQIEAIEATEKRLGVQHKVNKALKWARLYGGAVIIPDLPGDSSQEFVPNGRLNVRYMHVLHRYQITAHGAIKNPLSPYFGQPEYYTTNTESGAEVRFHPSRVILFNGRRSGATNEGSIWGDSIWQYLSDSVTSSDAGAAAIAALMQEAKVDVVRIENFMREIGGAQYEADQMKRWNLVATMKSIANVVLLDKEDEWDQKTVNWGGLPEVVRTLIEIMAGAADIPVTRLLGTSAAGLNATGEGDLRNYYDSVRAKQDLQIAPALTPLDRIILADALGNVPDEVWYDWKPLWQPSEKERAETQKIRAETYAIELQTGGVNEPAFSKAYENAAIETGLYPGIESAIAEFEIEEPEDDDLAPLPRVGEGVNPEERPMDQALNGAQITAVRDIVVAVTQRQIPFDTGLRLILLGFPFITEAAARGVLEPARNFQPPNTTTDAEPRTLYVARRLTNVAELRAWAEGQGLTLLDDPHVTITYSRQPVDWMRMGQAWQASLEVEPGGPRVMEVFGPDKRTLVLLFSSVELEWRHEAMVEKGASWDWSEYQPHVTIQTEWDGDVTAIEPYQGRLVFGPEIFEEVRED